MKHVASLALLLTLGVAVASAEERPVRMRFSGSMVPTSIDAAPNSITDEELLAGEGSLGSFTFRKLRTDALAPQPSAECAGANQLNIPVLAAGGVFRFEDGSLLTVLLIPQGSLCIDFSVASARLTETYQITGGTGRFKRVSGGTLNLRATLRVAFASSSGQPVLLTATGVIDGTVDARGDD
jgi:hypothetical protein